MTKDDLMGSTGMVVPIRSDQVKRLTDNAQARLVAASIRNLVQKHHPNVSVSAVVAACLDVGVFGAMDTDFGPQLPQYLRDVADSVEKHLAREKTDENNDDLPGDAGGGETPRTPRPKAGGYDGSGQGEVEN